MALNFGLLNTNLPGEIAGSVQRGQDEALRNQMAQQQLKTGAMQQESAQMQLEQAKRERDSLAKLQATFIANGKSPDMRANFQEMMQSGIPQFMDIGLKGIQALERQANVSRILGGMPTGAPAPAEVPAAAPVQSMMRQPAPMSAQNALGTGMYGMEPTAPANALAARPSGAYTPVMPRNALASAGAGAPPMNDIENTYRKIDQLHSIGEHELAKSLEQRVKDKLPPTAVQEYEYAKKNGYTGTFDQFKTLQAPRTTVNVPVNVSTEKKYGEQFAGKFAEKDIDKLTAAETAPAMAENANRIISLVSQGNVFTGPIADVKLNIARALNVVGASNEEKIANTETLIASTGQSTLNAIKGAGLGTGQGFTDKDLKFLQGIAGGTIGLTQKTLMDLATLQHRVATLSAEAWNKRAPEIPKDVARGVNMSTAPIKVPPLASVMGGGGIPPAAVQYLRANPATKLQFDQTFGPGAADKILGK